MKSSLCISVLISLLCCMIALAVPPESLKVSGRMGTSTIEDLRRRIKAVGKCNANVCFAIDGSGSISATEFNLQKTFVLDLVSVLSVSDPLEVAACQYASNVTTIRSLTADLPNFRRAVDRSRQVGGLSSLVGGIDFCISQLSARPGEANKIVILGDGRGNVGSNAIARLDFFRRTGGSVCAVGAGFENDAELLRIAGGNNDLVFQVDSFLDVLKLQSVIEGLVTQICVQ